MLGDSFEGDAFSRSPSPPKRPQATSGVGAVLKGVVKNIRPFGAFILTSQYARECLLHISNISRQRVENVEDALKMGQEVWVKVLKEEPDGRVSVSMKDVNQEDGSEITSLFDSFNNRGVGGGVKIPELNSIHRGTVKRIQAFGAFVALDGFDRDGLLHISCISKDKIDKVDDVLSVGDKVWVKVRVARALGWSRSKCLQVCKVDEDGKYGLDMRDISQQDGTDKDPRNLHRVRNGRGGPLRPEAIVLEAVVNATCARCGGKGHMAHECYNTSGKKYEMIEEEAGSALAALCAHTAAPREAAANSGHAAAAAAAAAATGANMTPLGKQLPPLNPLDPLYRKAGSKEQQQQQQQQRQHSKKKRKRRSSSSSSSSDEEARKKKKKKKHKEKKKHKKH
ncbi:S1 RNA-binding domain containing protein, putative [Eimeria tenella]|uniref:S1 RNA-binding domain containing protein, putative n=1 Tax=Eimeria tenella TaxID=5802 RepID=U6KZF1_EIMTE|nr:S1 RNA-binding domain containing protein, putative [Eimeria tenella]CDJ40880.1 S1 RNA-binding domain containing protein, putative [Eimeria tenella]|eukprot:XP_013231630.1 S1 RNA-binding domain containing protein, putative [Eimeria tenella]